MVWASLMDGSVIQDKCHIVTLYDWGGGRWQQSGSIVIDNLLLKH